MKIEIVPETDNNSETVDVSEKKCGGKVYIYIKVSVPDIGSFTVRLRDDIMKDSFTTSG